MHAREAYMTFGKYTSLDKMIEHKATKSGIPCIFLYLFDDKGIHLKIAINCVLVSIVFAKLINVSTGKRSK